MKYSIIIFFFICCTFLLYGQSNDTTGLFTEISIDSWEKGPLSDAYIYCTNLNTYEAKGVKSINGKALLYLLPNSLYLLEVSHTGFYSKAIHIETNIGKNNSLSDTKIIVQIILKKNCESDSIAGIIMSEAMGRVSFNRNTAKFEYDLKYTNKMEAIYEDIRTKRCDLAAKVKKAQKLAVEMGDSAKMAERKTEIEAEMAQLAKEIALLEEGVKIFGEKDLRAKDIALNDKTEPDSTIAMNVESGNNIVFADSFSTSDSIKKQKTRTSKFDERKPYIFIYPRHGWPSELAKYLKEPNYAGASIGTFSYDLTESRKDIFIEDAEELRKKFPTEFNQAFPNWDYIVQVNSPKN